MDVIDYIPYLRKKIGHDLCIAVGVASIIVDEKGRILIERRTDNGMYCLPGGSLDLNETVQEGTKREVLEETGLKLLNLKFKGILSGEKCNFAYPNGDVTQYTEIYFVSRKFEGTLKTEDQESSEIFFCEKEKLPRKEEWLKNNYRMLLDFLSREEEILID